MAELIRLDRPPADFCVSVSGLSPTLEISVLERYLRELAGGPLWSLVVHEDSGGGRRRWCMAFFYCESDCERCRTCANGLVLAGSMLSTQRLTKLRGSNHPAAGREGIPVSKATDLMNSYVGFNQWSSELLDVGVAAGGDAAGAGSAADRFVARMRVTVPAAGLRVTAEATGEGMASKPYAASSAWECRAQNKKAAVTGALKAALAKLCIIRFSNGKTVVRALELAAPAMPLPVALKPQQTSTPTSSASHPKKRPLAEACNGAVGAAVPSGHPDRCEDQDKPKRHQPSTTAPLPAVELCD